MTGESMAGEETECASEEPEGACSEEPEHDKLERELGRREPVCCCSCDCRRGADMVPVNLRDRGSSKAPLESDHGE